MPVSTRLTNHRLVTTVDGSNLDTDKVTRHNPYRDYLYLPHRAPDSMLANRMADAPRSFSDISQEDIDVKMELNGEHLGDNGPQLQSEMVTPDLPHIIFSNSNLGSEEGDPNVVPVEVALQRLNSSSSQTRHSSRRGSVHSLARSSSTGSRGSSPRHRLVGDAQNMIHLISKHKLSKEYFVAPDKLYKSQKICQSSGGIQYSPSIMIAEFSLPLFTQITIMATSNLALNQDTKHLAMTIGSIYLLENTDAATGIYSEFEVAKVALMIAIKMRERDIRLPTYKLIDSVCASSLKIISSSSNNSPLNIASPKHSNHSREKPASLELLTGTTAANSYPMNMGSACKQPHVVEAQSSQEEINELQSTKSPHLPSLEAHISCKFAWNLSFLTVHDYLIRFFFVGVLLDTDRLVGFQRPYSSPPLHAGTSADELAAEPTLTNTTGNNHHHRFNSEYNPVESGVASPRHALSMDFTISQDSPNQIITVKSLSQAELKILLTQIESDASLLCDLISERVLIPLRQAQVYAFYLLLLARAMSKITEDK
jgi:hypothetical protein